MKKVGKTTRLFRYDLNQISDDYTVKVRNRFKVPQTQRIDLWLQERAGLGAEASRRKALHIAWTNKVLLQSTGSYIQYPVINHDGKEYEKNVCIYIYIYVQLNHLAV